MSINTEDKIKFLTRRGTSAIKHAEAILDAFGDKVKLNPFYAMSWSMEAFEEAASHKVWSKILTWLEDAEDGMLHGRPVVDIVTEVVRRYIVDMASSRERSGSQAANLASRCELEAWGRVAREIGA